MKERPILMSAPMVRAILDGKKTQTRRIVKPQLEMVQFTKEQGPVPAFPKALCAPGFLNIGLSVFNSPGNHGMVKCPYGWPGDQLWVRETWFTSPVGQFATNCPIPKSLPDGWAILYKADGDTVSKPLRWRPGIHMPRWASRIPLELTSVRVERLQEISGADAKAEGLQSGWFDDQGETPGHILFFTDTTPKGVGYANPVDAYKELWESINGPDSWQLNPWVWVLEFKKL